MLERISAASAEYSTKSEYQEIVIQNGKVSHILRAADQTLIIRDGVYRNLVMPEDTNLDGNCG